MVNRMPWWLPATLQIMVSILNGCNNDIDHRADGTNAYPPTTVQWLEDAMERASQECPGKPIIVFTRIPPRWTCYSTWIEYENGLGWCMQVLNRVLNEYPQATDDDCVFRYLVNVYNVATKKV